MFGTFPFRAHVPYFYISYYSLTITLARTSSVTLAVHMRKVYCLGYTPRAWDPRSLQSILNVPLVFLARCYGSIEHLYSYYYYYYYYYLSPP